jgi:hypothetical protein
MDFHTQPPYSHDFVDRGNDPAGAAILVEPDRLADFHSEGWHQTIQAATQPSDVAQDLSTAWSTLGDDDRSREEQEAPHVPQGIVPPR